MLYIISGASRSGKTTIAKRVANHKQIPYLSIDWLMMGFTNGIPEYGIHDKLFPDEIAERMWKFLKAMLESMIYVEEDCVIEGEAILPELIIQLQKKYPDKLTICFLGYTEVGIENKLAEIRKYGNDENDWLAARPDDYINDHTKNMIDFSRKIESSCRKYGLPYFDTSDGLMDSLDRAMRYLVR